MQTSLCSQLLKSILDDKGNNVDGSTHLSQDSSWYVTAAVFANGDVVAKSNSYQIVFSEETSVAYSWGLSGSTAAFEVPFYVLNKNTSEKVAFEVKDNNVNNPIDTPPEVPPVASFQIEFDNFPNTVALPKVSKSNFTDTSNTKNHWGYSYLNGVFWQTLVKVGMAIPVAAFIESFNHQTEQ